MDKKNFNLFEIESNKNGIITGYASVHNVIDKHNDSIVPGAFKNIASNKVKFLWQHKPEEPIGIIEELYEDQRGLFFKAKLLLELPMANTAYNLLKMKAISGVSIGFKPTKYHYKGDVRIIDEIELWEISLVTFPANDEANILEVKSNKQKGENMTQKLWENFKSVNDEINNSIEVKGFADPLTKQHLLKISDELDCYKSRLDLIENSIQRPFPERK